MSPSWVRRSSSKDSHHAENSRSQLLNEGSSTSRAYLPNPKDFRPSVYLFAVLAEINAPRRNLAILPPEGFTIRERYPDARCCPVWIKRATPRAVSITQDILSELVFRIALWPMGTRLHRLAAAKGYLLSAK
jgi:hypothetical protein